MRAINLPPDGIAPLNSTADTQRLIGCKHTRLYELIHSGALDARKAGARTLITGDSIRAYIAALPVAPLSNKPAA